MWCLYILDIFVLSTKTKEKCSVSPCVMTSYKYIIYQKPHLNYLYYKITVIYLYKGVICCLLCNLSLLYIYFLYSILVWNKVKVYIPEVSLSCDILMRKSSLWRSLTIWFLDITWMATKKGNPCLLSIRH